MSKYKMLRVPQPVYEKYDRIRQKMVNDIQCYTGKKDVKLSMPKAMNAIVNPYFNHNYIEINLGKLVELSKKKRGRYE